MVYGRLSAGLLRTGAGTLMFTLIILACLAGDNCRPVVVAGGFVHQKQCHAYGSLMIDGWRVRNPGADVQRVICTDKPEYVIGRWQT